MNVLLAQPLRSSKVVVITAFAACLFLFKKNLHAQPARQPLYKVLTLTGQQAHSKLLPQDEGLNGIWQKLLKLQTTASMLHTQAHPDDEHADLLTYLSRGKGVRTAILSLNRGESGGNLLGPESFDQLALLRTEEFLLAANYYGLDDLYFTNLVDYGFSKRLKEAYDKWGRQQVLEEMVRVIRINRPLVVVSRFQGTKRDGHGNHQAAGEISQEAYRLAGDRSAFPEQVTKEGLLPWRAMKLYRGGVRKEERWHVGMNTGVQSAWLGDTYKNFGALGYSLHRSQNGGHRSQVNGSSYQYYQQMHSQVKTGEKEATLFEGLNTSISGIFELTGETAPRVVVNRLLVIEKAVKDAVAAFNPANPTAIIPYLTAGLHQTRQVIAALQSQREAVFMLQVKERQFMDALNSILSVRLEARALPTNAKEAGGFYEPRPTMGFAVPGQKLKIDVTMVMGTTHPVTPVSMTLVTDSGWKSSADTANNLPEPIKGITARKFLVTVPDKVVYDQPYYRRASMQESRYTYTNNREANLPNAQAVVRAMGVYRVNDVLVEVYKPVQVIQSNIPFGYNQYTLKTAPAIAVNVNPRMSVIPVKGTSKNLDITVELINNQEGGVQGALSLELPPGWQSANPVIPFSFTKPNERMNVSFRVSAGGLQEKTYEIRAIATVNGRSYSEGYHLVEYRNLEQSLIYYPALTRVKGMDVSIAPDLKVGYVMGVGDEIPGAIRQLGATVQLLTATDLATSVLGGFDVIVIGPRAYAVRKDVAAYNQRLLDFAKAGGHLLVFFQTPEFVPNLMAPFPALLPPNSEEVSEEDALVTILNPDHRVLNYPNKIDSAAFLNWVEHRGSKFFSTWDKAYTPIISTHDQEQAPQSGGWLMAPYGKGHYTYFAYALYRQLPQGVDGAYRLMANLLSYGKK